MYRPISLRILFSFLGTFLTPQEHSISRSAHSARIQGIVAIEHLVVPFAYLLQILRGCAILRNGSEWWRFS
jgi:hypothetical protein